MQLSIIIPVYNGEQYLGKCLDTIFSQRKELEFEVLIVDDASTDETWRLMKEYKRKYPREIKIFRHEKNMGVSAARNAGLDVACGAWIAFVDADDLLAEDFFHHIDGKSNFDLVLFDMLSFQDEKEITFQKEKETAVSYGIQERDMLIKAVLTGGTLIKGHTVNLASPWARIYQRQFIERHNLRFLKEVKIGEDMLFNVRAFACQESVQYVPEVLYYYRQHPKSAMCGYYENFIEEDKIFSKNLSAMLQELNVTKDIGNLVYSSALEGLAQCFRRQIFSKESTLQQEEKYALLDDILSQEPYRTAVNKSGGGYRVKMETQDTCLVAEEALVLGSGSAISGAGIEVW